MRKSEMTIHGLARTDREIFRQFARRLNELDPGKQRLVGAALKIVQSTYWPSLRCCIFRKSGKYAEARRFRECLTTLGIPDRQIRVRFFCESGSSIAIDLLKRLELSDEITVIYRRPPNPSPAAARWIGIDAVFPSGKMFKAVAGFFLLLRFAAGRVVRLKVSTEQVPTPALVQSKVG
jgi:hypothetical protein